MPRLNELLWYTKYPLVVKLILLHLLVITIAHIVNNTIDVQVITNSVELKTDLFIRATVMSTLIGISMTVINILISNLKNKNEIYFTILMNKAQIMTTLYHGGISIIITVIMSIFHEKIYEIKLDKFFILASTLYLIILIILIIYMFTNLFSLVIGQGIDKIIIERFSYLSDSIPKRKYFSIHRNYCNCNVCSPTNNLIKEHAELSQLIDKLSFEQAIQSKRYSDNERFKIIDQLIENILKGYEK